MDSYGPPGRDAMQFSRHVSLKPTNLHVVTSLILKFSRDNIKPCTWRRVLIYRLTINHVIKKSDFIKYRC